MLKLTNIMPLSQSSKRNITTENVSGTLEFTCTFMLDDVTDRPWEQELTVAINVSAVDETGHRTEFMSAQNVYAVSFTEKVDGPSPRLSEAVWPYVRPDIIGYFHTYSLPADTVPICGASD